MSSAVEVRAPLDGDLVDLAARAGSMPGPRAWLDSAIGAPGRGDWSVLALELEPALELAGNTGIDVGREQLAAFDERLEVDRAASAGRALGHVGVIAWEAARFFDAAHGAASSVPTPVIRFDRVRAAVFAGPDGSELVADGVDRAEAQDRLDRWREALETACPMPPTALPRAVGRRPNPAAHRRAVESIVDSIRAGRVYQACYTLPLWFDGDVDLLAVYLTLRANSPGDFGAWVRMGPIELASTSPERFVDLDPEGWIRSRPMKGTRMRRGDDSALARALAESAKDRAENIMIVDLVRNDIGRVAVPGTVSVPSLCEIETYATVLQMTSTVQGRLRPGVGRLEALGALFPPGSMSGAPRIEACRVLGELEAYPRGAYGGSIVWLGHDGAIRSSVVIRTLQRWGDRTRWDVGGGIVADSTAADEWAEALAKASPMGLLSADQRSDGPFDSGASGATGSVCDSLVETVSGASEGQRSNAPIDGSAV